MSNITESEVYKEQYAHFRSMNETLYKIPPIFTAILGGLWYFAVSYIEKDKSVAVTVFFFSAAASLAFMNVMQRFSAAFTGYIDNLNTLDGALKVSIKKSPFPSTIKTIQFLLGLAALISIAGAIYALKK